MIFYQSAKKSRMPGNFFGRCPYFVFHAAHLHKTIESAHHRFHDFKVVPGGYHRYFFGVKVKTVKLIGGTRFLAARSGLNVRRWHLLRSWLSGHLGQPPRTTLSAYNKMNYAMLRNLLLIRAKFYKQLYHICCFSSWFINMLIRL